MASELSTIQFILFLSCNLYPARPLDRADFEDFPGPEILTAVAVAPAVAAPVTATAIAVADGNVETVRAIGRRSGCG
jgi:hypothetical protein